MVYEPQDRMRLMNAVCARMEGGESLNSACRAEKVPPATVCKWADTNEHDGEQYARARDLLLSLKTEQMQKIADDCPADAASVAKAKLQIDQERWTFVRLMPKRAGDKIGVGGATDLPPLSIELSEAQLLAIAGIDKFC